MIDNSYSMLLENTQSRSSSSSLVHAARPRYTLFLTLAFFTATCERNIALLDV